MNNGQARRYRLWIKQEGICLYCQVPIESPDKATLDHVIPRRVGGSKRDDNLVLVCQRCNLIKGGLTSYDDALQYCREVMRIFDRLLELGLMRRADRVRAEEPAPEPAQATPEPVPDPIDPPLPDPLPEPVPEPTAPVEVSEPHIRRDGGVEITISAPIPMKTRRTKNAPAGKFDWVPGHRWKMLQTENPQPGAWPIHRIFDRTGTISDPLCNLFANGKLQGQALEDAQEFCFKGEPSRKIAPDPQKDGANASEPGIKIAHTPEPDNW